MPAHKFIHIRSVFVNKTKEKFWQLNLEINIQYVHAIYLQHVDLTQSVNRDIVADEWEFWGGGLWPIQEPVMGKS